jgi:hypothetical protein
MLNPLKTIEEARKYRYGTWAGNPRGHKYREGDCAFEVCGSGRSIVFYQCSRKNGHGLNKLYCKQHAKMIDNKIK